jgi:hypothetical protein
MLGRSVGEGGRGFGVDREEQASETEKECLKGLSHEMDLAFEDMHGQV